MVMTYLQPAVRLHVRTACSIFHPFPSNPRRNIVDNHPTEISSRSLSLFSPSPFFPALSKSLLRLGSPNHHPLPLSAAGLCRCRGQGRTAHRSSAPARRLGAQPLSSSAGVRVGPRGAPPLPETGPPPRHPRRRSICLVRALPPPSRSRSPFFSLSRSPSLALARWLRVRRLSSIAGVRVRPFGASAAAPEGRASTAAPPSPYQRSIC